MMVMEVNLLNVSLLREQNHSRRVSQCSQPSQSHQEFVCKPPSRRSLIAEFIDLDAPEVLRVRLVFGWAAFSKHASAARVKVGT